MILSVPRCYHHIVPYPAINVHKLIVNNNIVRMESIRRKNKLRQKQVYLKKAATDEVFDISRRKGVKRALQIEEAQKIKETRFQLFKEKLLAEKAKKQQPADKSKSQKQSKDAKEKPKVLFFFLFLTVQTNDKVSQSPKSPLPSQPESQSQGIFLYNTFKFQASV